jgi:hypothetical protein
MDMATSKTKKYIPAAGAPAVIIAPEHQSAPKTPRLVTRDMVKWNPPKAEEQHFHRGDGSEFDNELDRPEYHDRKVQAEMDALPRLAVSPTLTVEKMLELREMNYLRSKAQRWEGQERWQGKENEEARLVNIISPNEFIRRLMRAGISAGFDNPVVAEFIRERRQYVPTDTLTEIMGSGGPRIWLNDFVAGMKMRRPDGSTEVVSSGRVGLNAWVKPELGTKAEHLGVWVMKTVTSLQDPLGPEWSVMRFNEYNVPTAEKYRGWRTALLALIIAGVLTEEQAHEAFGRPHGIASEFYRQQLYLHRARKYEEGA